MSIIPFVIIGGGAAGLAAAIQLAELGRDVVLLEKNEFVPPRMCGEFISPECLPILNSWGIEPNCQIDHIKFYHANGKQYQMKLPAIAGSMARSQLEQALFMYAKQLGITLRAKQNVINIAPHPSGNIEIQLENQKPILAHKVIVSAGRYYKQTTQPKLVYKGLKAHFSGENIPDCLEMYVCAGAYFGIVPVDEKTVNVALLMRAGQHLPAMFKQRLSQWQQVDNWIEGLIPEFGIKPFLQIPQVYLVGDACASIPPITGDGVGMAITSGVMVAKAADKGEWQLYQKAWRKQFEPQIAWGKRLHRMALSPIIASGMISLVHWMPKVGDLIFSRTRGLGSLRFEFD